MSSRERLHAATGASPRLMALAALVVRLLAALPFGYGLTALTVSTLAGLLTLAGMARADAVVLMAMLGFVLYLLWLLWAFATRSLLRVYSALALGTACTGMVQQLLQPSGA